MKHTGCNIPLDVTHTLHLSLSLILCGRVPYDPHFTDEDKVTCPGTAPEILVNDPSFTMRYTKNLKAEPLNRKYTGIRQKFQGMSQEKNKSLEIFGSYYFRQLFHHFHYRGFKMLVSLTFHHKLPFHLRMSVATDDHCRDPLFH